MKRFLDFLYYRRQGFAIRKAWDLAQRTFARN